MTEPAGEASYSPVPSYPSTETPSAPAVDHAAPVWAFPGGSIPPPTSTAYGSAAYAPAPYAPGPYVPQFAPGYRPGGAPVTPPAPTAATIAGRRTRRRRLVIGLVSGFVLLVGACVGGGVAVNRARESFSDDQNRVTVRAPYSWDGGGDSEAVSGPPTKDEEEDYEIEDLYLSSFLATHYISVYIDDGPPTDTVEAIQSRSVAEECKIWTCESRGAVTPVTVGGHPGVEQILEVSDGGSGQVEVVMTVRTPTMTVRLLGSRDWDGGDPPSPDRLLDVLHDTTFVR